MYDYCYENLSCQWLDSMRTALLTHVLSDTHDCLRTLFSRIFICFCYVYVNSLLPPPSCCTPCNCLSFTHIYLWKLATALTKYIPEWLVTCQNQVELFFCLSPLSKQPVEMKYTKLCYRTLESHRKKKYIRYDTWYRGGIEYYTVYYKVDGYVHTHIASVDFNWRPTLLFMLIINIKMLHKYYFCLILLIIYSCWCVQPTSNIHARWLA